MRFSLKWMLAAVAFVGFGCVALYNAIKPWAMASFSLTAAVLLAAVVGSIHSNSRAFYTGMAVFGWGYLLLIYAPPMDEAIRPPAATAALMDAIYKTIQREIPVSKAAQMSRREHPDEFLDGAEFKHRGPTGFSYLMPIHKHYRAVGHSLFALAAAMIGGLVRHCFSRGANCDST